MQKKKIALIAARGNVGLDFLTGHISSEEHSKTFDVIPITRDYFDDERLLAGSLRKIGDSDIIFLPVKPKDALPLLILLKEAIKPETLIVSPVTGLSVNVIAKILEIPYGRIVKMTLNIHMAVQESIIVYSVTDDKTVKEVQELFHGISKAIIRKPARKIPEHAVKIGSGSAICAKHILMLSQTSPLPFGEFINDLTMQNNEVKKFVSTLERAFYSIFRDDSLVEYCYVSTLITLKKSCKSPGDISKHIDKVATVGGCTRDGVDSMNSLDILSLQFLTRMINKMHKKVRSFQRLINKNYNAMRRRTSVKSPASDSFVPYKVMW